MDYNYLTEHEKSMFGYIEDVPSEYEPIEDAWNEEYLEEIEAINDIFNIK
jgi:hypothetical protein